MYGQIVERVEVEDQQSVRIDATDWEPGIYLVRKYEQGHLQVSAKLLLLPR